MRRNKILSLLVVAGLVGGCSGSNSPESQCSRQDVETDTGLGYRDLSCGDGREAVGGTSVTIEYEAMVENEAPFATSDDQGGGFVFALGRGQVIAGLDEGVEGMRVGGTRRLVMPPELAYGDAGFPPKVGPGETIVYEVTLVAVEERG